MQQLSKKSGPRPPNIFDEPLISPAGFAPAGLASLLFDLPEPHKLLEEHNGSGLSPPFRAPASSLVCFSMTFPSLIFFSRLAATPLLPAIFQFQKQCN